MQKYFVLDTNVLLHNAEAIDCFGDNVVVLPMTVIEELDSFKSRNEELGRNARKVIRRLDDLRHKGRLGEGVMMENGGLIKIIAEKDNIIDPGLDMRAPDNRILGVAYTLHLQGQKVIFVSKDINARLKADALGIGVMDFERQKVNFEELYSGQRVMEVEGGVVDRFYQQKSLTLEEKFLTNQYVVLQDKADKKHTALTRAITPDELVPLRHDSEQVWNLRPRSREQRMALDLLMDPEVQLVTMVGQAGTGKTLLALAAALESILHQNRYDRILVSRPVVPMGKDIGYLPGDKDEKLHYWMQPIFDNLYFLLGNGQNEGNEDQSIRQKVDKLFRDHMVELEALTYIRGRSIPRQYVIIDEAQNLTPHEVKTIISRAGEGTKMVLTGDPYQIDNPYLDSSSNGLTYTAERLKGQPLHGHITLHKSERSQLAALAADNL